MGRRGLRFREKIFLAVILPLSFFLLLEGILRVIWNDRREGTILKRRGNISLEEMLAEGYDIDPELFWKLTPRVWEVSSQRFREDKIFAVNKPKDVIRIICMGDSVVYGCPEDVVRKDQTYPKLLEVMLNNYFKNKKIEVINAGVPGYSSLQGLRYLKKYLLRFNPDIVTCHFGPDDAAQVRIEDKNFAFNPFIFKVKLFLGRSYIYRYLVTLSLRYRRRKEELKPRVSPQDYKANLRKIYELCTQRGIKVVFITPLLWIKGRYSKIDNPIEYSPPEGVTTVDLYDIFSRYPDGGKFFVDNCHPTPAGHKVIAEALFPKIKTVVETLISKR